MNAFTEYCLLCDVVLCHVVGSCGCGEGAKKGLRCSLVESILYHSMGRYPLYFLCTYQVDCVCYGTAWICFEHGSDGFVSELIFVGKREHITRLPVARGTTTAHLEALQYACMEKLSMWCTKTRSAGGVGCGLCQADISGGERDGDRRGRDRHEMIRCTFVLYVLYVLYIRDCTET